MNVYDYLDAEFRIFSLNRILPSGACECGDLECEAIGKHPRASNWQLAVPWSDEQIDFMEETGQFATGFGVICKGHLIIDIDPRNGGNEGYEKLVEDTGIDYKKESGFVVATGGGGWHIYFKAPEGVELVKAVKKYQGVDFKSSGFVVGCGSMHKSGSLYEKEKGHPCDITEAPQKLIDVLERKQYQSTGCDDDVDSQQIADMLNHIDSDIDYEEWIKIGMAIHDGTDGEGFELWDAWSRNGQKYNGDKMDMHWHSFGKSSNPVTIGTLIKTAEENGYLEPVTFTPDVEVYTQKEESYDLLTDVQSIDLKNAPGLVGEIASYINSKSFSLRENLAIGAALNAVSNIGGIYHEDDYGTVPNLFAVCIAGSGTGKENVQKCQQEIEATAGLGMCNFGAIKSAQEIVRNLVDNQVNSYIIDEFGLILKKLSGKGSNTASYIEDILPFLMSAITSSSTSFMLSGDKTKEEIERLTSKIAYLEKREHEGESTEFDEIAKQQSIAMLEDISTVGIRMPYLSMIGYTTPSTFNGHVDGEMVSSGFMGRSILFEEKDNNPRFRKLSDIYKGGIPYALEMKIKQLSSNGEASVYGSNIRVENRGNRIKIKTEPEARSLIDSLQDIYWEEAQHQADTTNLQALHRRALQQVLKVSMILAMGDGKVRTVDHVKWAVALIQRDLEAKVLLAEGNIAHETKNKEEEVLSKVKKALSHDVGVTASSISRTNKSLNKEHVQKCLDHLEAMNYVVKKESTGGRGRPSVKYFIK